MGVAVCVEVGVGVTLGVALGKGAPTVAVTVGVAGTALALKPTRLDIAAGGVTLESSTTVAQVTCAEVLTMRANPCDTAVVVTTALSRNPVVPLVPKVTVAPAATFNTAPFPVEMVLCSVPSDPKISTPKSIGLLAIEVQKKSVSSEFLLIIPGMTAEASAGCPSENVGSAAGRTLPVAGCTPPSSVASETGGLTALSSTITLQRTALELVTTRAEPWEISGRERITDSKYAAVPLVPNVTVWPDATLSTAPTPAWISFSSVPSVAKISTPTSTAVLARMLHRKSVCSRPRLTTPGTASTCRLALPSANCGSGVVPSPARARRGYWLIIASTSNAAAYRNLRFCSTTSPAGQEWNEPRLVHDLYRTSGSNRAAVGKANATAGEASIWDLPYWPCVVPCATTLM